MRQTTWAIGTTVVFIATAALTPARADDAVDLRGPAPAAGRTTTSATTFKIKDATVTINVGGMKLNATQSLTATEETEVRVIAVKDRQATKVQTKMIRERVDIVTTVGGQEMKEQKTGDLEGEVIISERTGDGKWKHALVDTKPTDKQKKQLDKRVGPENEDDLYPEGMVKVGHTWTVEATALQRVFGNSITDLKGKLKMKFVKIEKVDGEDCAVIEAVGKISGVAKEDEGNLDVELDMQGTTWRSIKTGLDVKDSAKGTIKMSGTLEMGGAKLDLVLEGPFTIESTKKLKAAKP